MRYIILFFLLINSLISKELNITVIPYKNHKDIKRVYKPLITYIEKNSNYKVNLNIASSYENIIFLINEKKTDIAMLGTYLYLKNYHQLKNCRYLVTSLRNIRGDLKWYYSSYIITKANSNIKSIDDLKNKTFGFTNSHSTSGFIFPNFMLKEEGIDYKKDFKESIFLQKHSKIIPNLLSGKIEAGATYDQIVYKAIDENPNQIKILARSYPIPLDAFITTKNLDILEHKKIENILLNYKYITAKDNIAGFIKLPNKIFKDIQDLIKE